MKKLFRYFGGKFYLMDDIQAVFDVIKNKITCVVDVFGGSGTVLLNLKTHSKCIKIYNDIDSRLYKVMIALKDEKEIEKLKKEYFLTLRSREYFEYLKNKNENELTVFEILYLIANSFGGGMKTFGYEISSKRDTYAVTFNNIFKNYVYIRDWIIENLDFRDLIKKYDSETTFFYLDPPYLEGGKKYKHSFTIEDFKDLKNILDGIKGYYLLNESERDFEEIIKIFGEPRLTKEYTNHIIIDRKNTRNKRKEGFWTNFDVKNMTMQDITLLCYE